MDRTAGGASSVHVPRPPSPRRVWVPGGHALPALRTAVALHRGLGRLGCRVVSGGRPPGKGGTSVGAKGERHASGSKALRRPPGATGSLCVGPPPPLRRRPPKGPQDPPRGGDAGRALLQAQGRPRRPGPGVGSRLGRATSRGGGGAAGARGRARGPGWVLGGPWGAGGAWVGRGAGGPGVDGPRGVRRVARKGPATSSRSWRDAARNRYRRYAGATATAPAPALAVGPSDPGARPAGGGGGDAVGPAGVGRAAKA